jgi:hypothetical protein
MPKVISIAENGFCKSALRNVFLPSLETAAHNAFSECKIPNLVLANLIKAGYSFHSS